MNDAIDLIRRVVGSGILMPTLIVVPDRGATLPEIAREEVAMGKAIPSDYSNILKAWNGINLEVIVFLGCEGTHPEIPLLRAHQQVAEVLSLKGLVFAHDPSGFVYLQDTSGGVVAIDTDGGITEHVADGISDFVCRYVFGRDANHFADEEWRNLLGEAGLLEQA